MTNENNYNQVQVSPGTGMTGKAKDITDSVISSIGSLVQDGKIVAASGYDVGNAVNMAMIQIATAVKDKTGKPALEVCTKASIARSVLDMVLQGLMPERNQCWFIIYGNALTLQRSYFGTVATLKRVMPFPIHVTAEVIREGDKYVQGVTPYGERFIKEITTDLFESAGKPIKAVYCNIFKEGTEELLGSTFMSMSEVKVSWSHSKNYKADGSGPHNQEPGEMAKRTAIARACKLLVKSSTSPLNAAAIEAFNRTTDAEFNNDPKPETETNEEPKGQSVAEKIKAQFNLDPKENKAEEPAKPSEETGLSEDAEDLEKELAMAEDPLNTEELF